MATTLSDFKIASLAAGFTLGFSFLSCWTAIKQTRRISSPLRSAYIWMVWGEIIANLGLGVLGWVFLEGLVPPCVPVLFGILVFWVFEIQLLMQIIINRIYVVAENKKRVIKVKWITAVIITMINIMVFCIFIPAHLVPPTSENYVIANKYWDPTSKVLICIVDAALNFWFVRIVRQHLVRHHHLTKYTKLVRFNSYLMMVSVSMDVMLIGLMFIDNPLVFIQFHPVIYMVKLNIELSMAALIIKLARKSVDPNINEYGTSHKSTQGSQGARGTAASCRRNSSSGGHQLQNLKQVDPHDPPSMQNGNIHAKTTICVESEEVGAGRHGPGSGRPGVKTPVVEGRDAWEDDDMMLLKNESPQV